MIKVPLRYIVGIKPCLEQLNDYFRFDAFHEYDGQSRIGVGIYLYIFGCGSILTIY
jgi:hypothetical protein